MKNFSTHIIAPLALAAVVGAGSASAAEMTATIINNSTETANLTTSNYDLGPDQQIDPGTSGSGVYATGSNPNVTANATYRSQVSNIGCFFTAQAVYNSQRARYTFSSAAQSVGVSGGVLATCTSQITSSNSTTGDFNVTYRISGF